MVPAIHDGVGLDELGDFPGKQHILHFLIRRRALRNNLQVRRRHDADISILNQETARHPFEIQLRGTLIAPLPARQHSDVLLFRYHGKRFVVDFRRNNHFHELAVDDGFCRRGVQ